MFEKVREVLHSFTTYIDTNIRGKRFAILYIIFILILLGTAVSGWNWYDVQWFIRWTHYDLLHVYFAEKCAYFPLAPITFVLLYKFATYIAYTYHLYEPIYFIRFVTKLPMIISAALIAYILYRESRPSVAILWMFTLPTYSNIWALQFDIITALFLLLMVLLEKRGKSLLAGVCLAVAALYKQAVIVAYIPYLIYMIVRRRFRRLALFSLGFFTVLFGVLTPYLLVSYREFIEKAILFHADRFPQDLSIWNIPQILTNYKLLVPLFKWLWEPVFIIALFTYIGLRILYLHHKYNIISITDEEFNKILINDIVISILLLIFFNKVGNPGYFIWIAPLLLLLINDELYYLAYIICTIFAYVIYPSILYIPAVMLNKGIFIVEDLKYWPARKLFAKSIAGLPQQLRTLLLEPTSVSEIKLMKFLYNNFGYFGFICLIAYNILLIYSIIKLTKIRITDQQRENLKKQ
ncbi:MAG: DUF2029 domain-containing protein [Crenarchaeota archaeon]|nr:DUF2029 domain-containing protein [Thermoproteota archaeon]